MVYLRREATNTEVYGVTVTRGLICMYESRVPRSAGLERSDHK